MALKTRLIISLPLMIFAIILTGCTNSISIKGEVNNRMYQQLKKENSVGMTINATSGGGQTSYAIRIAKLLSEFENHLIIEDYCLSACAEDFLPSAKSVEFKGYPIIGFHWNSFMNRSQMIRYGGDVENCSNSGIDDQEYLHSLKNLNRDFWKETEKRLKLKKFIVVDKGEKCPWKIREFENHMWLPTSEQLSVLWGLDFQGSTCSDNIEACKLKVDKRWVEGTRIVIGDEVYVSKGKKNSTSLNDLFYQ